MKALQMERMREFKWIWNHHKQVWDGDSLKEIHSAGKTVERRISAAVSVCMYRYEPCLEVSSGFRFPSCQGFNVKETGSIQCSPIWPIIGLFFCCLKIPRETTDSYSDVVKCLWLGSPLLHHADLMERRGIRRQRHALSFYYLSVWVCKEVQPC